MPAFYRDKQGRLRVIPDGESQEKNRQDKTEKDSKPQESDRRRRQPERPDKGNHEGILLAFRLGLAIYRNLMAQANTPDETTIQLPLQSSIALPVIGVGDRVIQAGVQVTTTQTPSTRQKTKVDVEKLMKANQQDIEKSKPYQPATDKGKTNNTKAAEYFSNTQLPPPPVQENSEIVYPRRFDLKKQQYPNVEKSTTTTFILF